MEGRNISGNDAYCSDSSNEKEVWCRIKCGEFEIPPPPPDYRLDPPCRKGKRGYGYYQRHYGDPHALGQLIVRITKPDAPTRARIYLSDLVSAGIWLVSFVDHSFLIYLTPPARG